MTELPRRSQPRPSVEETPASAERVPALPRYVEIRRDLEEKILTGAWQPGQRVPSEHELVERYGCSRMTVSKALSAIAAAGLITRKRRAGSFVAAGPREETVLQIHDIRAEVTASGRTHTFEMLSRKLRPASERDGNRLRVAAGTELLHLTIRHLAGGKPLVIEDRLLNLEAVPAARAEPFDSMPPGSWLLSRIPWTAAEHVIRAVSANASLAGQLGIKLGTACLQIERRTWQAGVPLTAVRLTYPGDRHELIGRFSPSSMPDPA